MSNTLLDRIERLETWAASVTDALDRMEARMNTSAVVAEVVKSAPSGVGTSYNQGMSSDLEQNPGEQQAEPEPAQKREPTPTPGVTTTYTVHSQLRGNDDLSEDDAPAPKQEEEQKQ